MRHVSAFAMKNVFSAVNEYPQCLEKKMHGEKKKVVFQYDIHFLQSRSLSSRLFSAAPGMMTAAQAVEPVDQLSRLFAPPDCMSKCP